MAKVKKICTCGNDFEVYPYRAKTALFCSLSCRAKYVPHKKGYKSPKGSLAKLGEKNPMYGKNFTRKHRQNIGKAVKASFTAERRNKYSLWARGEKNPHWVGDAIGYEGIHDWIQSAKGVAKIYRCEMGDKTCKGRLEWSNKSQKYLRNENDWQVLCASHHRRYDIKMLGIKPWNKKN